MPPFTFGTSTRRTTDNPTPGILQALMLGQQMKGRRGDIETGGLKREELQQKMALQALLMNLMKQKYPQMFGGGGTGAVGPMAPPGPVPGAGAAPGPSGGLPQAPVPGGAPSVAPGGAPGSFDPTMDPIASILFGVTPASQYERFLGGLPAGVRKRAFETKAGLRPKAGELMRMELDFHKWKADFNQRAKRTTDEEGMELLKLEHKDKIAKYEADRRETLERLKADLKEDPAIKRLKSVWEKVDPEKDPEGASALTQALATLLRSKGVPISTEDVKQNLWDWLWGKEKLKRFKFKAGPPGGTPSSLGLPGQEPSAGPSGGPAPKAAPTSQLPNEGVQDWYNRLVDSLGKTPQEALSILKEGGVQLKSSRKKSGQAEAAPPKAAPSPLAAAPPAAPAAPAEVHPLTQLLEAIMKSRGSRSFEEDERALLEKITPSPEFLEGVRRRARGESLR